MKQAIFIFCCLQTAIRAQEATSGFEVRATASESASYTHQLAAQNEGPLTGGFRAVLYPTWKLNDHWAVSGAIQTHSTPYFFEEFSTQHYGVKTDVLQANLSRSEEHTSELQSRFDLVCRLLLEKKKYNNTSSEHTYPT